MASPLKGIGVVVAAIIVVGILVLIVAAAVRRDLWLLFIGLALIALVYPIVVILTLGE